MCTIADAKVRQNYNCYNVYFNECLRLSNAYFKICSCKYKQLLGHTKKKATAFYCSGLFSRHMETSMHAVWLFDEDECIRRLYQLSVRIYILASIVLYPFQILLV